MSSQQRVPQRPASVPHAAPGQAVLSQTASKGVDLLWRYQLRKENAALLEKLEASNKMIETTDTQNARCLQEVDQRISALQATFSKIHGELSSNRQVTENLGSEVSTLKRKLESLEQNFANAKRRAIEAEEAAVENFSTLIQTPTSRPARQVQSPVPKRIVALAEDDPASPATTASSNELSNPPTSPAPPRPIPAQPRLVKPLPVPTPKAPAPVIKGKLNVPAAALRTCLAANSKTTTVPKKPTMKPLKQGGHRTVESYHTISNTTFNEQPAAAKMAEPDFVAFFIRGLRDITHREKLTKELMKTHPSRGREDGTVEILCAWEDVGEALRKIGLLSEVRVDGMVERPKRKKMTLLPPGMMIDNLMSR